MANWMSHVKISVHVKTMSQMTTIYMLSSLSPYFIKLDKDKFVKMSHYK